MNHGFKIDEQKCIKCGLCTKDCFTGAIERAQTQKCKDGASKTGSGLSLGMIIFPKTVFSNGCIYCT